MKYLIRLFFIPLLFISIIQASEQYPRVYESLGDEIYFNLQGIENLKTIQEYKQFHSKIDRYVTSVNATKQIGFAVQSGIKADEKLYYLQRLREHKKINDYFLRSVKDTYKYALDNQNTILFLQIVNNGLLNTQDYKSSILNYYNTHSSEINPQGVIQEFLDEELALKNKKRYKPKSKEQIQAEKVKRVRENDKLEQEQLEKKLSEELKRKKELIIQEQEKELFN